MRPETDRIPLSLDFSGLAMKNDLYALIRGRKSERVYTDQPVGTVSEANRDAEQAFYRFVKELDL